MNSESPLNRCRIIEFPRHSHHNGTIAVAENTGWLPFELKRVFYIFDIPADTRRGGHSHNEGEEIIIAVSGSFNVKLTDGQNEVTYTLNRPYRGLYVAPHVWIELDEFSSGCQCLTLCSNDYDETDYVKNFDEFKMGVKL